MTEEQANKIINDAKKIISDLLSFVTRPNDHMATPTVYIPPAALLRIQADLIDRKDAAINAANIFLASTNESPAETVKEKQNGSS